MYARALIGYLKVSKLKLKINNTSINLSHFFTPIKLHDASAGPHASGHFDISCMFVTPIRDKQ